MANPFPGPRGQTMIPDRGASPDKVIPIKNPIHSAMSGTTPAYSSGESSPTDEEERLRKLFQACDRDSDGFIDSNDLLYMCQLLNMEDSLEEIMQQLGVVSKGRISFQEFVRCRRRLVSDGEHERDQRVGHSAGRMSLDRIGQNRSRTNSHDGLSPVSPDYSSSSLNQVPEITNLYRLLQDHEPGLYQQHVHGTSAEVQYLIEVLNALHMSAMSSLINTSRMQQISIEKEVLEKQLRKQQMQSLRVQREMEERFDQTVVRYEDRLSELHNVISELKKTSGKQSINMIREEDENIDDADCVKSTEMLSFNDNNGDGSQTASLEIGNEINEELSRVVSELETAIQETRTPPNLSKKRPDLGGTLASLRPPENAPECRDVGTQVGFVENYGEEPFLATLSSKTASETQQWRKLEEQLCCLKEENVALQEQRSRQEIELNKLRAALGGVKEERDYHKRKNHELQNKLQSLESTGSRNVSAGNMSPSKQSSHFGTSTDLSSSNPNLLDQGSQSPSVPKVAGLKKLKTLSTSDRQILGSDIAAIGLPNAKVAEHLVQNLKESCDVQEITQSLNQTGEVSGQKVKEFEIEVERLQSKIDHLKSHNDMIQLWLSESKAHCDRMTVLMGKYESNGTAMQLALTYSDSAVEGFQVLMSLVDSEVGLLLANCKASGLGNYSSGYLSEEEPNHEELASLVQKAQQVRRSAENVAKHFLMHHERANHNGTYPRNSPKPWEDLSNSHTASTTSSTGSSSDTEWSKVDEQKLRDFIVQLVAERTAVRTTVVELESVLVDPLTRESLVPSLDSQKLDLENAVLMQELMAMKEEKSELKAQNYLLEKEKSALELEVNGQKYKEQAYQIQIKNLKSEVIDRQQNSDTTDTQMSSLSPENLQSLDLPQVAYNLDQALKRERRLKTRVQELVNTLEIMSQNSEYRHQQSTDFVNDLRKANSALIVAFEKAKRKYQAKLKKQDTLIQTMKTKHETQIQTLIKSTCDMKLGSKEKSSETAL